MRHKACISGLPTRQELATHQLGLFTKLELELEALPSCSIESTGMGGGWVDEMQNKTEAQPAQLQLAAGAAAGAQPSLAIKLHLPRVTWGVHVNKS